jgi:SAM-dependent methyltransferase
MNPMTEVRTEQIREAVRDHYARAALDVSAGVAAGCCGPDCCSSGDPAATASGATEVRDPITRDLYSDEAAQTSAGALAASLGCGNPILLADLAPGETVLDLGSGGGLDVLLSARRVGPTGMAYGLDMTPEMLDLARRNQAEAGVRNAEFLMGTIEDIPLRDGLVDVVISNCVINLSGDKDAVLAEAFRVTRPGGRFAVADIVLLREIPEFAGAAMALWTGCIAGALLDTDYVARLTAAGYVDARVEVTRRYDRAELVELAGSLAPQGIPEGTDVHAIIEALDGAVASAFIRARRPLNPEE